MIKIRKAKKTDLIKSAKLMKESFNKPPYKDSWTIKSATDTLTYYYKIGIIFVATIGNNIVGFIAIRKEPYNGEIYISIEELVVKKSHQRKGVGKKLIQYVEDMAEKVKADTIYLTVVKKAPAFLFYKNLDYKESKEVAIVGKKFERKIK